RVGFPFPSAQVRQGGCRRFHLLSSSATLRCCSEMRMLNPVTALGPLSGQTMHNATRQGRASRGKSRGGAIAKAVRTVFEKLEERRLLSAGQLDTTFAGSGKVLTDFSNGQ